MSRDIDVGNRSESMLAIRMNRVRRWGVVVRAVTGAGVVLLLAACQSFNYPVAPENPTVEEMETRVARLVNDYRRLNGCGPLAWDVTVAGVAREHSSDMVDRSYFGHEDPDGNDLADRLRAAGIEYSLAAENIARGFRYDDAARAVFEGWLESPAHRSIIENCGFSRHGVGFVDFVWTHVFVR